MKNNTYHISPATLFFLLTLAVFLLSWVFDIYGLSTIHPQTGEEIAVRSLLSAEGIRWMLRNIVHNFTSFGPLGSVLVAILGIGLAEHSGFINACIRFFVKKKENKNLVIITVILLGIMSNTIGDTGYIILIPISATLFSAVGINPIAGIITAYVSVAGAYSANLALGTLDPLLSNITQVAINTGVESSKSFSSLSNYYFMSASVLVVGFVLYVITKKDLIPRFQKNENIGNFKGYQRLSRKEKRALRISIFVGIVYSTILLVATFPVFGFLRGIDGSMTRSPFIQSALFLITFGIGLMSMFYGFISGKYRNDSDVVSGFIEPVKLMASYFVIAFFAAQLYALLDYSNLDKCLGIISSNWIASLDLTPSSLLFLFILLTALLNLFMVSATAKWSFMAFIFIPLFTDLGISADWAQCAFRVGDSVTNIFTPFLFYIPLVLSYMLRYDKTSSYATFFKYTWKYAIAITIVWTLFFAIWFFLRLPLGI